MEVRSGAVGIEAAFAVSVAAAGHLTADDTALVEAARALARKIDAWDVIVDWALEDAAESESRPSVPANDNTSLPTFLKYCESLGLSPAVRKRVPVPEAAPKNELAEFKSRPKRSVS